MTEMTLNQASPKTELEYENAIELCLTEMRRTREQINNDQQDIDRLKAETQAIIAELRTL